MVENVENAMTITQLKSQVDGLRDYLWSSGLPNPGDHVEQISYLLFLKMLEERDDEKAELLGDKYKPIFSGKNDKYRWSKLLDKSGRELLIFVRDELFPFMSKVDSNNEDVSEYFHDAVLKITKPDVLHDLIQKIDNEFPLEMLDNDTKGDLYEYLLSKMDAAGELGQFRTPRHLISFITEMVNPQIGETVVDPACGTGGFLIASYFNILKNNSRPATLKDRKAYWGDLLNDEKRKKLEHSTLYGFDVDQGMIRFARMNLLLHGLEAENVKRRDAIAIEYGQGEDKQYDIVLTNPPFAGRIDKTRIKKDLPIIATKTEILFLGHAIQLLKNEGRCGIIVPEGLLFGNSTAHKDIRRYLLESCDLQAVVSMPSGAFMPYSGVKTSVLIFQKGRPTSKVWFYELDDIGYGLRANPLPVKENDIPDLLQKWKSRATSEKSWITNIEEIKKHDFILSATVYRKRKNSNSTYIDPDNALEEAVTEQKDIAEKLNKLKNSQEQYAQSFDGNNRRDWPTVTLNEACEFLDNMRKPVKESERKPGQYPYYGANGQVGTIDKYIFDEPLILLAEDGGNWEDPSKPIAYMIIGKSWVNNHAHVLRPRKGFDILFVLHSIEHKDVRNLISGTTRGKLTKRAAESIEIVKPPLELQMDFAKRIKSLKEIYNSQVDSAHKVKQASNFLLKKYFGID